ncbi:MAG: CoA transferase [Alphaproteobacteria bacterium]|nr:CoA transferase [Alphaproteobacteria bacterium]
MAGSLEGINVLDLTHALSGPFCSMLLAELGANIIKIEPPSGDHFRPANNGSTFAVVNRNKRSICIDLKNPESVKVMNSLISRSDIMLENFTPGTARRLGYDYERVKKIKTDIIYASISGFGQSGPYRDLKGYDAVAQAMSGIMASTGEPDRAPVRVGPSMIDMGTGMYVVIGIMDALRKKDIEGQGRYLEFNLLESALSWMSQSIANYSKTGVVPPRTGSALGSFSPYQVFNARDDQIFIGASTELFWQKLCGALNIQALLTDQRFIDMKSRVTNRNVLTKIIENTLSHMSVDAILQKLRIAGIPCAPVLTVEGVVNDPHVKSRKSLTPSEDSTIGNILQTKMPIGDGTPPRSAPKLGEHNNEILEEYGFSKQEIQQLKDSDTIID